MSNRITDQEFAFTLAAIKYYNNTSRAARSLNIMPCTLTYRLRAFSQRKIGGRPAYVKQAGGPYPIVLSAEAEEWLDNYNIVE